MRFTQMPFLSFKNKKIFICIVLFTDMVTKRFTTQLSFGKNTTKGSSETDVLVENEPLILRQV